MSVCDCDRMAASRLGSIAALMAKASLAGDTTVGLIELERAASDTRITEVAWHSPWCPGPLNLGRPLEPGDPMEGIR